MTPRGRRKAGVTFVIMAGGHGERLWPLVRASRPKVCLSPDGRRTLLKATIDRLRPVSPAAQWLIVTTQEQAAVVRASLPHSLRSRLLVEPEGRNTAACITLAASAVAARDPGRIMVVAPADHWIGDEAAYRRAVKAAMEAAVRYSALTAIGVKPQWPHPGLGYLCAGQTLAVQAGVRVRRMERFVEKPSAASAQRLIRQGACWNSGMFVATAEQFLESITVWLPSHADCLAPLAAGLRHGATAFERLSRAARSAYRALQAISFDHGVMEHLADAVMVEGRFAWADVGSWEAWARLCPSSTKLLALDSHRVTVVGNHGHLVAALGVRDMIVVHTPSATLICSSRQSQRVREIVKRLERDPALAAYR